MGNLYLRIIIMIFPPVFAIRTAAQHTTCFYSRPIHAFIKRLLLLLLFFFCFIISRTNVKKYSDKYIIFSRDFSRRLARGGARFLTVQFERVR